jgi:hypothetical protein
MPARNVLLYLLLFSVVGCGKRGLPPSPDRWAPKLAAARAADRNHVDVIFSEKLDRVTAARRQSYVVTSEEGDTLQVHSANLMPNGQTVRLTTQTQESVRYSVFVSDITDAAGNELRPGSAESFEGSTERDSDRPQVKSIYPAEGSIGVPADSAVRVFFSETMDTSSVSLERGSLIVLPPPADSVLAWNDEMSSFSVPILALTSQKTSVYVMRGCTDYGGNSLLRPERSTFTTGDTMPGGIISGVLTLPEVLRPFQSSIGLFDSVWTPLSLDYTRDSTGSFTFSHVEMGRYIVAAAKDEDGDGDFDLRGVAVLSIMEDRKAEQTLEIGLTRETLLASGAEKMLLCFHLMNLTEDKGD